MSVATAFDPPTVELRLVDEADQEDPVRPRRVGPVASTTPPPVRLEMRKSRSVAPAIAAIVRDGVNQRPELARETIGVVVLDLGDMASAVRMDFRGDEILISDEDPAENLPVDLRISGDLVDIVSVVAAPLAGGLPKPTHPRGRQAIARLADGRVDFDGPLRLARKVLLVLALEG